jgi:hypothetical protein
MHDLWDVLSAILDLLSFPGFPARRRGQKLSQMEEMQRASGIVLLIILGFILFVAGIIWLGSAHSHP